MSERRPWAGPRRGKRLRLGLGGAGTRLGWVGRLAPRAACPDYGCGLEAEEEAIRGVLVRVSPREGRGFEATKEEIKATGAPSA